ncbi:hypothetical protein [Adhaeribacter soli]|uniref:SWFGD domain-containing protein n=1 Tax=Adhaeribacter soli TaxID=2607655 RepID=A0A5N1J7F9_9BACT|nr:hypothetical protein [Adhaeribacter soli]KAA9345902.1 hypothetical protein F0P94_02130 [Adhaeribacter soli]
MRNYENIGYDSFNSYRSGDENSNRNLYGGSQSNPRGGSSVYGRSSRDTGSSEHNYSTDPGYYGTGSSNISQNRNQSRSNMDYSNRYGQSQGRSQNMGNSWVNQGNQNQRFGQGVAGAYGTHTDSGTYGGRYQNRSDFDRNNNWQNRVGNQMDRWGDRASNAWNRMTDDQNRGISGQTHPHHSFYSHGNAYQNRYSDSYDSPSSFGNRYENERGYESRRPDRDEDEGFLGNIGHKISNVWDRFVGNDEDEERRYQERSRYGSTGSSSYENRPPYNYGSSSNRDYEW